MKIDAHSHVPIYLQIVEQIRGAIASGVFRSGEALPTQRNLAITLGVNPNTVQKAFDELERQGLARSRRGVGMFVALQGVASAQDDTRALVEESFRRGVFMARESGVGVKQVREIFRKVLVREYENPTEAK